MVEITQWPILIALFSQCVPPSRVCYCRTGGYTGQGGDAEAAESEHFLSNNLKSCGVKERHTGGKVQGVWILAGWARTKCQITRFVKGM